MPIAQLDRVTGYEPVGRGFESLQARHVAASDMTLAATFLQKSPVRVFCRVSFFEKGHAALLLFDALLLSGLLPTIFGKVRAFESVCQKQKDIFCMAV